MRGLLVVFVCLLAGCVYATAPDEDRARVRVLGNLVSSDANVAPATVGDAPAPALVVQHADVETVAKVGSGVSITLVQGGARLVLINHGEWVRTSLRWTDPSCTVSMRTPTLDQLRHDVLIPVANAVGPDYPYVHYSLGGACSGDAFVLWSG